MEELSDESYPSHNEVTNPIMMFARQMIFEDTDQEAAEAKEILA